MKYFVVGDSDQVFDCKKADDITEMDAEECADQYYSENDGWEDTWPVVIGMKDTEDGPVLKRYTVYMEALPQFSAYEKDEPAPVMPEVV